MKLESTEPTEMNLSLLSILQALRRNIVLITVTTLFFVSVVAAATLSSASVYESSCTLWIQRSRSLLETNPLSAPEPSQPLMAALLNSRTLRLQVCEELKLRENPDFWGKAPSETTDFALLETLDSMVFVFEVRTRPLLEVSVKATTPELAQQLVTSLVQAAIDKTESLQVNEAAFFTEQYENRKARYTQALTRVSEFERENGLVTDLARQSQVIFETNMRLRESLLKAESERAGLAQMMDSPTDFEEQLDLIARADGLRGTVDYLHDKTEQGQQLLARFPELSKDYKLLQAEVVTQQELLKETAIKTELAKFEAAAQAPKVVLVEEPNKPDTPVNELPTRLALALVFGLAVGLVLTATREALRHERSRRERLTTSSLGSPLTQTDES